MLSTRAPALLVLCFGLVAYAQEDVRNSSLRLPQKLTVGVADQFLGQLSADGKTLYFVSNRNTTNELYSQNVEDGHMHLLFDEGADVTWPRVSPDGHSILYISFRENADGQLCVRSLPKGDDRRCLDSGDASALQAEWMGAHRILMVSRPSIVGDLRVTQVDVHGDLSAKPLFERNLTSPSISPDGKWLVYVPVQRYSEEVGPAFAAKAAPRLEAQRLDRPGSAPIPFELDLPGFASQPTFARDGQHLYVVQFFSDSNHDGVIDASDHGVLFRVVFPTDKEDAPAHVKAVMPEQLTDASWNCQYPSSSLTQLAATCSTNTGLDIFEMPLDGEVPGNWTNKRLEQEIEASTLPVEELLLYRHLLSKDCTVNQKRVQLMRLMRLHLDQDEFIAAQFYVDHVHGLKDPATAGIRYPLTVFVEHRKALREREWGRMSDDFGANERKRLAELLPEKAKSANAAVLVRIVRSEIADTIGRKAIALQEFQAAVIDEQTPPSVLEAYYERADALYRGMDDRDHLVGIGERLSRTPGLTSSQQLDFARAAVRNMIRGLPWNEAEEVLARKMEAKQDDSELTFALQLNRAVLAIRGAKDPASVADSIVALYRLQKRPDRRRALMEDAIGRATERGADAVIEALAEVYVNDADPGTLERRHAEQLYRRALTSRGYRRRAAGNLTGARADFETVVRKTGSYEAVLASVNLRLRAKEPHEQIAASFAQAKPPFPEPLVHFVRAYLKARELPDLKGDAHAKGVQAALGQLRSAWAALKNKPSVRALFGAILHEDYLSTGNLASAEKANTHYMIALESVQKNPRFLAMILGQLGILHTEVGNYHIALKYLQEREKLPFAESGAGLSVRMARARALLHVGKAEDAAKTAEEGLVMVKDVARLGERYRVLILDRAALYNLAAGKFQRAVELYDQELPLVSVGEPTLAARNSFVVHLARAAANLGANAPTKTLQDLDAVDKVMADPEVSTHLQWAHAEHAEVLRTYQIITAGLRANANQRLGNLDAVAKALETRRLLFEQRYAQAPQDEQRGTLALVNARLAVNATERHDLKAAAQYVDEGLKEAERVTAATHGPVSDDQMDLLWFAAQLSVQGRTPVAFDLKKKLVEAYDSASQRQDPTRRTYQRWFEAYLPILDPSGDSWAKPPPHSP